MKARLVLEIVALDSVGGLALWYSDCVFWKLPSENQRRWRKLLLFGRGIKAANGIRYGVFELNHAFQIGVARIR